AQWSGHRGGWNGPPQGVQGGAGPVDQVAGSHWSGHRGGWNGSQGGPQTQDPQAGGSHGAPGGDGGRWRGDHGGWTGGQAGPQGSEAGHWRDRRGGDGDRHLGD